MSERDLCRMLARVERLESDVAWLIDEAVGRPEDQGAQRVDAIEAWVAERERVGEKLIDQHIALQRIRGGVGKPDAQAEKRLDVFDKIESWVAAHFVGNRQAVEEWYSQIAPLIARERSRRVR